jgi:hypothetical protein
VTTQAPGWRSHPLAQLTLVRYREFLREPEAVFWVFVFPVLLTAGLGIAFRNQAPERVPVVVVAGREGSAPLAEALGRSPALSVLTLDDSSAARALRTGKAALLVTPDGPAGVRYRFDPDRPDARSARLEADDAIQRAASGPTVRRSEQRSVSRGPLRGLRRPRAPRLNLMGSGIWGLASPSWMRGRSGCSSDWWRPRCRGAIPGSFVLAADLLVLEVAVLLSLRCWPGVLVADRRSPWLPSVSRRPSRSARSGCWCPPGPTIEGVSGLMSLVMLPMWIFSGVFFSASRFPDAIQPAIQALPLTAVNDALRAVMLEGAGPGRIVPELGVLAAWMVVSFLLALRLFRWR